MATYKNIVKGLELLAKKEGADQHHVSAEHDIIYAGREDVDPDKLTDDELTLLDQAGWIWDADVGSWRHFV